MTACCMGMFRFELSTPILPFAFRMAARISLARALVRRPALLLLDEVRKRVSFNEHDPSLNSLIAGRTQ